MAVIFCFMSFTQVGAEEDTYMQQYGQEMKCEAIKPHIEYYHELLIERFTPDRLEEWKDVVRERHQIIKKVRQDKGEGEIEWNDGLREKYETLHKKFSEAVKARDEEELKRIIPSLIDWQKEWNEYYKQKTSE